MSFEEDLAAKFGKAMHKGSDAFWHTDFLRTGIPSIDHALGGGFGYGRMSEIFGGWSSGKTMILYHALGGNQKVGGTSILFEAEGAFDSTFYTTLGGDADKLHVYPVDTVEDVFDGIITVCDIMADRKKAGDNSPVAIGWDSIAATGTKHLRDVGMEKRDMSKSGAMSTGSQLVATKIKTCRVALIATNQVRDMIGSMDSETHTPGGKSFPFACSQRIELGFDGGSKTSMIWSGDKDPQEIGRWTRGKVVKNKLASPFGKFKVPIYVQEGFDHPDGFGSITKFGIDEDEALLYMYLRGMFLAPDKTPVLTSGGGGWYTINEAILPGGVKFQKKTWKATLDSYPKLRTLVYDTAK